ncbi:MAG: ABC transporter permease [Acidimicrobiaceae bacterium]|nr:ABC transporter permease [Acidimicrobiaceae bacterium]
MNDTLLVASIASAISSSTAVLIAATGELLVEKTGVYNIALEGVMLVGALAGFLVDLSSGSWLLGLLAAAVAGGLFALLYGVITVLFRTDLIVVGVALILVAQGVTDTLGTSHVGQSAKSVIPIWNLPLLSRIPFVGPALFRQSIVTYVAILLPVGAAYLLNRTRHGLNIKAIGENPEAADTSGISVIGWRLFYTGVGGAMAGIGGAVITLGIVKDWVSDVTAGEGWIAFAVVFFSGWQPGWVIAGAYFFGALSVLGDVGQALGWSIPSEFFTVLPYIGTILVMILRAWLQRRRGAVSWPAALGLPFYRG